MGNGPFFLQIFQTKRLLSRFKKMEDLFHCSSAQGALGWMGKLTFLFMGVQTVLFCVHSCVLILQQQRELERAFNRPVDPRKKILSDMESFVNTLHSQGHIIILAGDANEDMNNPSSAINKFLSNCKKYKIIYASYLYFVGG